MPKHRDACPAHGPEESVLNEIENERGDERVRLEVREKKGDSEEERGQKK